MPTLTVNLAKTYALSLKQNKAEPVDWQTMPGKNKLRRFFVHNNWEDYIASVSVSSAGLKGGVFFLEAYVVEPADFGEQLRALNINMTEPEAMAVWRALHANGYLAGGIMSQPTQPNAGWVAVRPTETVGAVVKSQVMQPGFALTGTAFGRNAAARNTLLSAIQTAAQLQKRYVVKGTNEPGRTLFAEYVLNTIGKAKIPKSLVLEVDPSRPHTNPNPSEGMIMLNLINTRRNPAVDAARYNAAYANLHSGAQPVVDYLVVQKLLAAAPIMDYKQLSGRVVEFLCDQRIIVDVFSFSSDQNFAGESSATLGFLVQELTQLNCLNHGIVDPNYPNLMNNLQTLNNKVNEIQAVLAAALPTLGNNQLQRQDYVNKSAAKQFDQLVHDLQNQNTPLAQALTQLMVALQPLITINERILSDATRMKNTGRVHFADALLGNGDRFANFNTGNFFYVTRQAAPGSNKATNPVGCIDNDSFLPTYLPFYRGEGWKKVAAYVNKTVNPSAELWGWDDPQPQGMVMAPNMSVIDALDYDNWFTGGFFREFIRDELPTTVLELYSANFFVRGDNAPFTNTQALLGWSQVHRNLREGVARALADYQGIANTEFQAVYQALAGMYYPGPNFEFTAFEIRDRFLRKCLVDQQNWTVQLPSALQLKTIQADIVDWLIGTRTVNPECDAPQVAPFADAALTYGLQIQCITPAVEQNIRTLLRTMALADQARVLPKPFGPEDKRSLEEQWNKLPAQSRPRMARVVCALLSQFRDQYIAEIGYLTNDRRRVFWSNAFQLAMNLCDAATKAKLYKDSKRQGELRKQVLNNLNLGGDLFLG